MEKGDNIKMKHFCKLGVCLGMVVLACIGSSCSNKPGIPMSDAPDTNDITITQTTNPTTRPSSEESTLVETSISSEASSFITITPPTKRVYPINNQDVIDLFNAMGLVIKDVSPTDGVTEKSTVAFDPDYIYYYRYESFFLEEKAIDRFEAIHDAILEDESGRTFEGTCDITEKDGYTILVGRGNYERISNLYWVAVLVDKTVVSGFVYSTEESDMQMIDNYFIGLGYI